MKKLEMLKMELQFFGIIASERALSLVEKRNVEQMKVRLAELEKVESLEPCVYIHRYSYNGHFYELQFDSLEMALTDCYVTFKSLKGQPSYQTSVLYKSVEIGYSMPLMFFKLDGFPQYLMPAPDVNRLKDSEVAFMHFYAHVPEIIIWNVFPDYASVDKSMCDYYCKDRYNKGFSYLAEGFCSHIVGTTIPTASEASNSQSFTEFLVIFDVFYEVFEYLQEKLQLMDTIKLMSKETV